MSEEIFGQLFSAHILEEAVEEVLKAWLPVYRQEIEEQYDLKLPSVQTWGLETDFTTFPDEKLPAVIVAAGGIGDGERPERHRGGEYKATWGVGVVLAVHHPDSTRKARTIAQLYGAVIRGIVMQNSSLNGQGQVKGWTDETYPYEVHEHGTRAATENTFLVQRDGVVDWRKGPRGSTPPPELPATVPTVQDIEVRTEIDE